MTPPPTPCSLVVVGFLIVGAVALMGASLGTTHWIELDTGSVTANFGLFKLCVRDKCVSYDDTHYDISDIQVCQGLCITACVFFVFPLVVMGHLFFVQKMEPQSKGHGHSCLVICIVGAILAWSGVGHFTTETGDLNDTSADWNYGYSLYLASTSGVLSILAGIFAIIGVNTLINSRFHTAGFVMQSPALIQPTPGVQVVTPTAAQYGFVQNPGTSAYPNNFYPTANAAVGTQPATVMGVANSGYSFQTQNQKAPPPAYY